MALEDRTVSGGHHERGHGDDPRLRDLLPVWTLLLCRHLQSYTSVCPTILVRFKSMFKQSCKFCSMAKKSCPFFCQSLKM